MTEKLCHTAKNQEQFQKGRVSIVTPVYNGEKHLSQMLESVLLQTYGQIEMILVDDGSTDGTLELAESYRDKFAARGYEYHLIRAKHKNAAGAINGGLPYVTGEYLIWPDSDDVLKPESVERRVRFLQERPQYQCVRSQAEYFDISTGEILENREEKTGDLSKEDLFWDMLEIKTFVCCGCYMLRSDRFFEIYSDRHIPEYDVGQNFQMLLPFLYRHRCPTIQEVLYRVAVRPDSHSRRALSRAEEEKKYRDYEALVDEIAHICQIGEKVSKDRITCWKARRRFQIAVKYGQRKQAAVALWQLWRHGGLRLGQLGKAARSRMKKSRIVRRFLDY